MPSEPKRKTDMKEKIGISLVSVISLLMMTSVYFSREAKSDIDSLKQEHKEDIAAINKVIIANQELQISNQRAIMESNKNIAILALEIKHIRERQDEDKIKTAADVRDVLRTVKK